MTVMVAQLGARMHYAVPRILQDEGLLEYLYTDICAVKGWPRMLGGVPSGFLPPSLIRLRGRIPEGVDPARIIAFTAFGQEYAKRRRAARSASEMTVVHLWAGDRFNELINARGFGKSSIVYGFNSASEGLFRSAKANGIRAVLEQTSAPKMFELGIRRSELDGSGEWELDEVDHNSHLFAEREQMEWQLADVILCPSEYVRTSIAAVNGPVDKCQVVPYGVDSSEFSQADSLDHQQISGQPLRVLYVGSVGVMKGIVYLLKAMSKLSDIPVQCRIVGAWRVNPHVLKSHTPENVELVGPVPRVRIAQEYKNADVFCLPSLSEGSATVVYEALAAGLPVVTTHHSGTIVRDEVEGFIVPIRDPDAIAESLCQLASDRSLLASMSEAAYARSAYGSLDTYGSRLLEALEL